MGASTFSLRPERSVRGSVLPVHLGEPSERALPSGTVPLALESALFDAEVPHCPVGAAHQDLRAEEGRMARRARPPCPDPPAPARPAAAHLSLAAGAPAQGAHRLLAPRLSRRREVRRLFALKVHPCGSQASVASGTREDDPHPALPDARPRHAPFRIPVSVPTHTWFQRAPAAAITEPEGRQRALPAQRLRHRSAPRAILDERRSWAFKELEERRSLACCGWFCFTRTKSGDACRLTVES